MNKACTNAYTAFAQSRLDSESMSRTLDSNVSDIYKIATGLFINP